MSKQNLELIRRQKRLAWCGDAVVSLVVRDILSEEFPDLQMPQLVRFADVFCSNKFLNEIANCQGLVELNGDWKSPATRLERFLAEAIKTDGYEFCKAYLEPFIREQCRQLKEKTVKEKINSEV